MPARAACSGSATVANGFRSRALHRDDGVTEPVRRQGRLATIRLRSLRSPRTRAHREVGATRPIRARTLDSRYQRIGATATIADALWKVVGRVLNDKPRVGQLRRAKRGFTLTRRQFGIDRRVTTRFESPSSLVSYDVLPSGREFLMLKPIRGERGDAAVTLIMNWPQALGRARAVAPAPVP